MKPSIFQVVHRTWMKERKDGTWIPVCEKCGPLLEPRSDRRDGVVMLEAHERHVRHQRGPDRHPEPKRTEGHE